MEWKRFVPKPVRENPWAIFGWGAVIVLWTVTGLPQDIQDRWAALRWTSEQPVIGPFVGAFSLSGEWWQILIWIGAPTVWIFAAWRILRRSPRHVHHKQLEGQIALTGILGTVKNPTRFQIDANVEPHERYGASKDGAAFYVRLHVKPTSGLAHAGVRGRLLTIIPLDTSPGAKDLTHGLKAGNLQWESNAGGGEVATVPTGGAHLDVLAFENNDHRGVVVYADDRFRQDGHVLLAASDWELTIEVFADDGASSVVTLHLCRGTVEANSGIINASREGTLYGPLVSVKSGLSPKTTAVIPAEAAPRPQAAPRAFQTTPDEEITYVPSCSVLGMEASLSLFKLDAGHLILMGWAVRCVVTDPTGYTLVKENMFASSNPILFRYPDDFSPAHSPVPGNYTVIWFANNSLAVSALGGPMHRIAATKFRLG